MVLAIHPTVYTEKAEANICDNFVVTDTGGKRLQRTPQEIFVV
jgi:Xaa-Pro aminopeptidase